jgi:hypothetical protein
MLVFSQMAAPVSEIMDISSVTLKLGPPGHEAGALSTPLKHLFCQ